MSETALPPPQPLTELQVKEKNASHKMWNNLQNTDSSSGTKKKKEENLYYQFGYPQKILISYNLFTHINRRKYDSAEFSSKCMLHTFLIVLKKTLDEVRTPNTLNLRKVSFHEGGNKSSTNFKILVRKLFPLVQLITNVTTRNLNCFWVLNLIDAPKFF